jgi:hypothetical protein
MKVGMEVTIIHYQGRSTIEEIGVFVQSLERDILQHLSDANLERMSPLQLADYLSLPHWQPCQCLHTVGDE